MQQRYIMIVEDDALLRDLLATSLEANGLVVQTAGTAADAKRLFSISDPDCVILDIELGPGPNGFELAQIFLAKAPETAIVFLTNLPDQRFASEDENGLPKGIAYLRKSALTNIDHLLKAVDAAMRGAITDEFRHDRDTNRPLANLTKKQIAILKLLANGQSNAQIAESRGVTVKAVEDTIRRACAAIGIDATSQGNTRTAAVSAYLKATKSLILD